MGVVVCDTNQLKDIKYTEQALAHRKYHRTLLLLLLLSCNVLVPFVPISTLRLVFLLLDSSADGGLVDGLRDVRDH